MAKGRKMRLPLGHPSRRRAQVSYSARLITAKRVRLGKAEIKTMPRYDRICKPLPKSQRQVKGDCTVIYTQDGKYFMLAEYCTSHDFWLSVDYVEGALPPGTPLKTKQEDGTEFGYVEFQAAAPADAHKAQVSDGTPQLVTYYRTYKIPVPFGTLASCEFMDGARAVVPMNAPAILDYLVMLANNRARETYEFNRWVESLDVIEHEQRVNARMLTDQEVQAMAQGKKLL